MGVIGFSVKVVKKEVVVAEQPWHDHWLPFSNLDLLVPPIDVGSFMCFKKPVEAKETNFTTVLTTLKSSLSQALVLYYPLAGEIVSNRAGELEIHCNNRGVDFVEAVADVELRELNFYNPDDSIEGKLMPKKKQDRALAIQVTSLKCGGMVIGYMADHRVADAYSINLFISSWADRAQSKPPSLFPSFQRSLLYPRRPSFFAPSVGDLFVPISPSYLPKTHSIEDCNEDLLISRIYYVEGQQLERLQSLASKNGCKRSKVESFTSFLWKITASCLEDSGYHNQICTVIVAVDGRRRLAEGDGDHKEKLLATYFGNVLSMPFGEKTSKELNERPLSWVANEVHEFIKTAASKEHFLDLIDWVEYRRPQPLISKAFAGHEKAFPMTLSSGRGFTTMNKIDFGWGNSIFGSCHVPSERQDCYVMTLPSPVNDNDWVIYMRMPKNHVNYIEEHANHFFKPLTADYLKI